MKPQEIIDLLQKTPDAIFECDTSLSGVKAHLDELKDSLSIAELNAELSATMPEGKSNLDTRKQIKEAAVQGSEDVKRIKSFIRAESIRQSGIENERSKHTRTFSAALAMAELAAAQLYFVAARTRKETLNG